MGHYWTFLSDNLEENATLGDNSWTSPVIRTTGEANFGLSVGYMPDALCFCQRLLLYHLNVEKRSQIELGSTPTTHQLMLMLH